MTVAAKHKHKKVKDPTSSMWMVWAGFFILLIGGGVFYLLSSQIDPGHRSNMPGIILTLAIITAGISFIGAWVNR